MALLEIVNTEATARFDISTEQEWVRNLVPETGSIGRPHCRRARPGYPACSTILERVLLEIAHSPSTLSSDEFNEIRQRIESQGIIFKVHVLGSDVRERQLEATRAVPRQRS